MTIQQQIDRIKHIIKRHDYNWYVLGKASISKGELAALKAELNSLEREARKEKEKPVKEIKEKPLKKDDSPKEGMEFDELFGDL